MKGSEVFSEGGGSTSLPLREQVDTAERAQIWQAVNELRYIFRHALLREAVYDMQYRSFRENIPDSLKRDPRAATL